MDWWLGKFSRSLKTYNAHPYRQVKKSVGLIFVDTSRSLKTRKLISLKISRYKVWHACKNIIFTTIIFLISSWRLLMPWIIACGDKIIYTLSVIIITSKIVSIYIYYFFQSIMYHNFDVLKKSSLLTLNTILEAILQCVSHFGYLNEFIAWGRQRHSQQDDSLSSKLTPLTPQHLPCTKCCMSSI